jgi:hypothetical protein
MDKLQIQHTEAYNDYWWSIRFTGPTVPFNAFVCYLRQCGYRRAYWVPGAYNGRGAWCVEHNLLMSQSGRFDNLEVRMGVARRAYERKKETV